MDRVCVCVRLMWIMFGVTISCRIGLRTAARLRMLTLIDEYSRECLAIDVERRLTSEDVLERLSDLFVRRGLPTYIR